MCCVITDGGGAVIVAREDLATDVARPAIRILGAGEHTVHRDVRQQGSIYDHGRETCSERRV